VKTKTTTWKPGHLCEFVREGVWRQATVLGHLNGVPDLSWVNEKTGKIEHTLVAKQFIRDVTPQASQEGMKFDDGKARLDLLPPRALLAVGQVLSHGAKKYAPDNWKKVPNGKARYIAASLRHIFAYMGGEMLDPESGEPHLAHAITCLLFALELEKT